MLYFRNIVSTGSIITTIVLAKLLATFASLCLFATHLLEVRTNRRLGSLRSPQLDRPANKWYEEQTIVVNIDFYAKKLALLALRAKLASTLWGLLVWKDREAGEMLSPF